MKCVGIQYLEAIRKIKENGGHLQRTLHISFVPGKYEYLYIFLLNILENIFSRIIILL